MFMFLFVILCLAFIVAHDPTPIASGNSLACSAAGVLTPQSPEVPHFGDLIITSIRKHFLITTPVNIFQPLKTTN